MSSRLDTEQTTTAFDILATPKRRYLLAALSERTGPLSLETLAVEVAVTEHGTPIVTDEQVRNAHIELLHCHVPRLLDEGLLTAVDTGSESESESGAEDGAETETESESDTDGARTIALADHPILEAEWVSRLLDELAAGATSREATLNRTLEALQPARRRTSCAILARQREPLAVADLAAMLAARTADADTRLVDLAQSDWKPFATRLVHNDLPALAEAGLVEYDRSSQTVSIAPDAPQWRSDWLAASPLGEIGAMLETSRELADAETAGLASDDTADDATSSGACWTIEGQENVVAAGQDIADHAEEELFVTVPDGGMIQRRCLERWRAAAERGVDVYIGSESAEVQETVQSAIPEATVCEPQSDWLNFPVEQLHHGRVVFADRERVMLVTIDDENGDLRATAITGEGAENTLVKLVREHVGPRLDRLESRRADGEAVTDQETPLPL
ncbi:hypothetical protein GS429_17170 [Natronorubrum sp. JWXQ-INN-674]|uniref:DUF7344 domain-containing protein n=1 Tax=Natronorubrum halalkaliphilum TaxID=2691917 RepID=A0A6B0VT95_9EURY|nr:hypothetical protein [Natronorubrum halalkaliphilum]MXV63759.1 hypothetical protein [Natronorubrum halalkaliphilum]